MKTISEYTSVTVNKGSKLSNWVKIIAVTGFTQSFIQALGLLSGILVIRYLSTTEYAFYTIANTMLGTMTVLADGGISSGVMAQGGMVWQDRKKLGVVIATGLRLRTKFAIYSIIITMPILLYLLMDHGAGWVKSIMIMLAIIPSFFAALSDTLLEIGSKLHQQLGKLQKNQTYTVIGRFIMLAGSVFIFPWTFVVILCNGIPRILANIQLKHISAEYADPTQPSDPIIEKEIVQIVKRSLPGAIYYCISSQITLWLISIFGSTQSIAHIGALGRLTTLMTVFSILFTMLVIPRFARLPANKSQLFSKFMLIEAALYLLGISIVAIVVIFPKQILWILGKDYAGLNTELTLITISSSLSMLLNITYAALVARGWILRPLLNITINIAVQIILIFTFDLSDTKNILMFSIIDFLVSYIIVIVYFFYKINKLNTTI